MREELNEPEVRNRDRVLVWATHPIQYQTALWRQLARVSAFDVHVCFGAAMGTRGYVDREFGVTVKWDVDLTAGYAHSFLPGAEQVKNLSPFSPSGHGMAAVAARQRPAAVVVNAYSSLFWLRALAQARLRGLPVVMRHEASDVAVARDRLKSMVRDALVRAFYRRVAIFAYIGVEARRHLARLGVDAGRLVSSPYCVDTKFFEQQWSEWLPRREELRAGLGIPPGDVAILFSGKLIPKKDPLLVLEALRRLPSAQRAHLHTIFLGTGALQPALVAVGRELLGRRFHAPGFVNQGAMGRWFTTADCLILPSRKGAGETWGLVVNEALQFGLPVLASDGVGCVPDLIQEGTTGFAFPSGRADLLASLVGKLAAELPSARARYARSCRAHIANFSVDRAAAGLEAALHLALRA